MTAFRKKNLRKSVTVYLQDIDTDIEFMPFYYLN